MSKKRVKVFSSGKYPQGDYPPERVKKIFGNATKSNAIFIHTSKWKGNKPPKVGEFSGFELIENGNEIDVFANIELNDKGKIYHSDSIFKGISVEIPGDKLTNIALLPLGVNPAVEGAEFSEETLFIEPANLEFEEVKEIMKFEDVLSFIFATQLTVEQLTQLMRSLQLKVTDKQAVYNLAREFAAERLDIAAIEEVTPKTLAEIEKEFEAKYEKKSKAKDFVKEFMQKNSNKLTPAMKEILTEKKLENMFLNSDVNYEFDGKKESPIELLEALFSKIPNILNEGQIITEFEKNTEKEETPQEYAARIHGKN